MPDIDLIGGTVGGSSGVVASYTVLDVQKAGDIGFNVEAPPFAIDPQDGDLILVGYATFEGSGAHEPPTDTSENVYVQVGPTVTYDGAGLDIEGINHVSLWACVAALAGTGVQVAGHSPGGDGDLRQSLVVWLVRPSVPVVLTGDVASSSQSVVDPTTDPAPPSLAFFFAVATTGWPDDALTAGAGWNAEDVNGFTADMAPNAYYNFQSSTVGLYTEYQVADLALQATWTDVWGFGHERSVLVASFAPAGVEGATSVPYPPAVEGGSFTVTIGTPPPIASTAVHAPGGITREPQILANTIFSSATLRAPKRIYDPAAPTGLALDPDIWCELRLAQFPADQYPTVVYRFALNPLADGASFKEGRLISVGPISRTWSDIDGNFTPGSTTVVLEDSDGLLRGLLAQETGTEYFVNREAAIYVLSAAGRAAGLTPRMLFRGWISDVQAVKGRRVQIAIADVVGSQFCGFNLDKLIPSVTLRDVSPKTPDDLKDQVLPIYLGEHSDRGAKQFDPTDTNGDRANAEKGLLPVYDLGDYPLDGSSGAIQYVLAPINLKAEVIGEMPEQKSLATVVGELQDSVDNGTLSEDYATRIGFADADALQAMGTVPSTFVALAQVIGYGDLDALMGNRTRYTYAVSAITATGESNICPPVSVYGPRTLDHEHHVRLTWEHADALAEELTVAFRICGRDGKSEGDYPTTWLYANNNIGTFVDPELVYDDDGRHTQMPSPNPGGFNTAITDPNVFGLLAICIGYGYDLLDIYASNLAEHDEPRRKPMAFAHPPHGTEVVTWADPEWPHPNPWIEMNGIRFTGFYLRGHRLAAHRDGTVTIAVNMAGPHTLGDGTVVSTPAIRGPGPMRVIDQAYRQFLFVLNEHVAKNNGTGYRTGDHWPLETYDNGDAIFQTTEFERCQNTTIEWIGGYGHLGAIAINEPITVREFVRRFCRTFGCHIATNHHGQVFPLLIQPGVLPTPERTPGRALREHIEIIDIEDGVLAFTEVLNRINANYHWDSDAKAFRAINILAEHLVSIAAHSPGALVGSLDRRGLRQEERDLFYTNDETTALSVLRKELARRARRPRYIGVIVNLMGLDHDIGSIMYLTHSDGLGVNGDVNVPMLVIEQHVDPTPSASVTLRLQDLRTMWPDRDSYISFPT